MGRRTASAVAIALILSSVSGCAAPPPGAPLAADTGSSYPGVAISDDLDFGGPDGTALDVCAPAEHDPDDPPLPGIIAVHGGGWTQGDKRERPWRDVCGWLAASGFVVFQTNYRLAPDHPFPAAIDDLTTAVEWIRDAEQVERFDHDPARLGAFGDSAGGNLVSLLGTRGEGETTTGSRVSAVVEVSAPLDLTLAGTTLGGLSESFQRVQLDYLGCSSYDDCPAAAVASPISHVDRSDPPFFIIHSVDEFIPVEQADLFASTLGAASIEVTMVRVPGEAHALGLLDDQLRARITEWLHERLA
jgi:acetyl esterase/lipase